MKKLKPCPFCGNKAEYAKIDEKYGYSPPFIFVKCSVCWCSSPTYPLQEWERNRGHFDTTEKGTNTATKVWNQRRRKPANLKTHN